MWALLHSQSSRCTLDFDKTRLTVVSKLQLYQTTGTGSAPWARERCRAYDHSSNGRIGASNGETSPWPRVIMIHCLSHRGTADLRYMANRNGVLATQGTEAYKVQSL